MKYKKSLLSIILILIFILKIDSVNAATLSVGSQVSYDGLDIMEKNIGSSVAFCISGFNVSAHNGDTCSVENSHTGITAAQRAVIGQIINIGCGSGGCSTFGKNYVIAEAAIIEYLQSVNNQHVGEGVGASHTNLLSDVEELIKDAKAVSNLDTYEAIEKSSFDVEFNTDSLSFTKSGDVYKSQTIKLTDISYVSGTPEIKVSGVTGAQIVGDASSFYISIPAKNVTQKVTITLTASAKQKKYEMAQIYKCSVGQDVAKFITGQRDGADTIKGIINPNGSLTINKVDKNNQHVKGAKIKITGPNNYLLEYVTDGTSKVLNNLTFGTYIIKELASPDGYVLAEDKTINLSSTSSTQTVNMVDEYNKVIISKLDATGTQELPGATLEIQDKDGNIIKYCTDLSGNKNTECKWISTDKPYIIEGIPTGKYYLIETIAPDRYVLNKEKVEFEVKNNVIETKVMMKNKLNKVKISKTSVATSKELPGATLEIQDKDGKIVKYCTDSKGNKDTECKWVSTDKPYEIEGMPNGTYYLVETLAPQGYVLSKEKIEFIVDGNKEIVQVEMKNNLEVKVPNTLSGRSALLVAISMFDIALGIGILTYVKKNKVEE